MMGLIWGQIYKFIIYGVLETDAIALIAVEILFCFFFKNKKDCNG